MKKKLLLSSVLFLTLSTFAQTGGPVRRTGLVNTKLISEIEFETESFSLLKSDPVKAIALPKHAARSSAAANTWQDISSSMNIYGVLVSYAKPLQWNDELNAVSFIQRKSPTYVMNPSTSPAAESGGIVAMVSLDCGAHWDSTALFSDNNFWGRYPGGAIYNPNLNTDIKNAYVVGAGPTTGVNADLSGNWYASKKLGIANYNNAASSMQVMPTAGPFSPNVPSRHDFAGYGFSATDNGNMHVLAGITDDNLQSDTAVMLMTGTFNNGVFDWTGKVFDPPTTFASDGTENWISRPIMAWNEQGTVGYVVVMGSRMGATLSNAGYQPIVYKTINSGSTWSLESGINFNLPAYDALKNRLWHVDGNEALVIPQFYWGEGMDATVDAKNSLHIFTSILAHVSGDPDSLNHVSQWGSENYLWPHDAIEAGGRPLHPYLYDFIYDGTNASPRWGHVLIDSMSTECPGQRIIDAGYLDNPWNADPSTNNKVRVDARLQMSRTPDGKHILYSWAESDTNFTDGQKKWNTLPNLKARLMDVVNESLFNEIDITEDASSEVANRAMCHFMSPKSKLISAVQTNIKLEVPLTVSNSNPYSQLTTNTHRYSCASVEFKTSYQCGPFNFLNVGIEETNLNLIAQSMIYPNPASNFATLTITLEKQSVMKLDIYNSLGQLLRSTSPSGQQGLNNLPIDLTGLEKGIYFVNVKIQNTSATKKLVIE